MTLSPGDPNCTFGGSAFTSASGVSYACNGSSVDKVSTSSTDPSACTPAHVGEIYFNSQIGGFMGCDGQSWVALSGNAGCDDVTRMWMPHYGTGNCPTHSGDQRWLSSKSVPTDYRSFGAQFDTGFHDSTCGGGPMILPAFAAINLGSPRAITRARFLLHTNPMKGFLFQGSNDSTNGSDGTWTSLFGPVDMPSGYEQQWWEGPTFTNTTRYKWYRIYSMTTAPFAFYRWAMFEC